MAAITDLVAALRGISDRELAYLRDAINHPPKCSPGLAAWIEHATDWAAHRRGGHGYPLQGPRAAIDDSEIARGLTALTWLAAQRIEEREGQVAQLLDIAAAMLLADAERSGTLH